MKISIVTINYNNAAGLKKTLESVACQQLPNGVELEHVIVDGGSTDGSVEVINGYRLQVTGRYEVKWVSERDKGIYNAMNKGIKMASGEWIVILNSADCLASPTVIAEMAAAVDDETDVMLGNVINVWPEEERKQGTGNRKQGTGNRKVCVVEPTLIDFYQGTIPHDAALIRKSVYETYGYYDEEMKICSDWKLFLHAMVLGNNGVAPLSSGHVKYTDVDMVLFDMTGTSNQNTDKWMAEKRPELEKNVPARILADYDRFYKDIILMKRIHRHPIVYKLVRFMERVLFKIEKWGMM